MRFKNGVAIGCILYTCSMPQQYNTSKQQQYKDRKRKRHAGYSKAKISDVYFQFPVVHSNSLCRSYTNNKNSELTFNELTSIFDHYFLGTIASHYTAHFMAGMKTIRVNTTSFPTKDIAWPRNRESIRSYMTCVKGKISVSCQLLMPSLAQRIRVFVLMCINTPEWYTAVYNIQRLFR